MRKPANRRTCPHTGGALAVLAVLHLAACTAGEGSGSVPDAAWYDVVASTPGPEVTDPDHRRRLEASGHPWKVRDRATGIELVLVLPGEFLMGSPESEAGRGEDEGPRHRVRLTHAYYLGATEVSQAQWDALMGATRFFFHGPELPAEPSYTEAHAFLDAANAATPTGPPPLRLPTEAEWEYACRAGTTGPFAFDGPPSQALMNHNDGVPERAVVVDGVLEVDWLTPPSTACPMTPLAAGSLPPNPWGLHDLHGNLWEWCEDGYSPRGYETTDPVAVDPLVLGTADGLHVLRGGSWYDPPEACRSAARDAGALDVRSNRIGFRVARSL